LILDAGNALFGPNVGPGSKEKTRAAFILSTMGKLGTRAMVAGHRDLPAGTGFLLDGAKKAGVQVLSANLQLEGKPVFPGSTVIEVGGTKVGIIGVSPAGPVPGVQKLIGTPVVASVQAELLKLPKDVQLRVVLAAVPYSDAMDIGGQLKEKIDLVLQSGDLHPPAMQPINHNYLVASGERGRVLEVLTLRLDGIGDFENLDETERAKELLVRAESNLAQLAERQKKAEGEWAKAQLDQSIADITRRRDELKKTVNKGTARGVRTIASKSVNLDAALGDDPELLKQVLVIEPPGTQSHP
jgi:2',3'-cyclic-nucleotide 2'-phosphodiesterase (5'-nucleotidase family)